MKSYKYKVQGVDYEVEIVEVEGKMAKVNVNGVPFELEMQRPINKAKHPLMNSRRSSVAAPAPAAAPAAGPGTPLKAPLPGTITEIKVQVGQQVNVGDVVVVLEAMKMQNNIESDYAGKVTSIVVKQGETVMEGSVIMTIG